ETIDKKLNQRLVPGQYLSTWFPVFFDRNRNVYAWFDGGRWDVADFGANARTIIESVPNAWAQKFLPQGDYSPNYFPFVH
ncbi:GDSL family lipase, partial [Klebsiella pneumoniae]|nr:GDSL family lipase [Klebsiella pneumoniae]MDW5840515.1 GDSL family lipase [Klebsiella pneumoniae]MDW5887339.1 GDSL family lipase [Klebsiella pneumoniae]